MKLKRDVKTILLVGFVTCGPLPRRTMVNLIQKRVKMFGFNFSALSSIHVFIYMVGLMIMLRLMIITRWCRWSYDSRMMIIQRKTKWSPAAKNSSGVITPVSWSRQMIVRNQIICKAFWDYSVKIWQIQTSYKWKAEMCFRTWNFDSFRTGVKNSAT